jgi:hypothetical protein
MKKSLMGVSARELEKQVAGRLATKAEIYHRSTAPAALDTEESNDDRF